MKLQDVLVLCSTKLFLQAALSKIIHTYICTYLRTYILYVHNTRICAACYTCTNGAVVLALYVPHTTVLI